MKIGLSTSVIQRGKTGIAQHVFALLRALDALDHAHSFTLFVLEEDRPLFQGLGDRFEIAPVHERFRPALRNIAWHQTVLPRLARERRLDLLHVPSYRRLIWSAPCPRVATIHDLAPFHLSGKYDLARMFYGRVVVRQLARRQDAIIAVSDCTARDLERFFGIPRRDVRVIHNGLDHDRFKPEAPSDARRVCAEKFGLQKPFVLYVARLEHPGKNHVRLIEAFEKFKQQSGADWQLVFGGSDWHGAEVIHQRIAGSPQRESIRTLGFVRDEDLPSLYSAASAFCYPSLFEGFGMPPLEAMACGCPAITSARGSLGEVVGDAAEIVNPEDPNSIAEALWKLCRDPEHAWGMIARGMARAREFSWSRAARDTLDVYEKAARTPHRISHPNARTAKVRPLEVA